MASRDFRLESSTLHKVLSSLLVLFQEGGRMMPMGNPLWTRITKVHSFIMILPVSTSSSLNPRLFNILLKSQYHYPLLMTPVLILFMGARQFLDNLKDHLI